MLLDLRRLVAGESDRGKPLVSGGDERPHRHDLLAVGQCFLGALQRSEIGPLGLFILPELRERFGVRAIHVREVPAEAEIVRETTGQVLADREGPLEVRTRGRPVIEVAESDTQPELGLRQVAVGRGVLRCGLQPGRAMFPGGLESVACARRGVRGRTRRSLA